MFERRRGPRVEKKAKVASAIVFVDFLLFLFRFLRSNQLLGSLAPT